MTKPSWSLLLRRFSGRFRSIRARLAALVLATLILVAAYTFWAYSATSHGLLHFEELQRTEQMKSALVALRTSEEHMVRDLKDYACWDETLDAVKVRDQQWIQENISEWVPKNFHMDVIMLVSRSGQTVYHYGKASEAQGNPLRWPWVRSALAGRTSSGLLRGSQGLMLLASTPILRTDETGPPQGAMVYARWLTSERLQDLKEAARADLTLYRGNRALCSTAPGRFPSSEHVADIHDALSEGAANIIERTTHHTISVYHLLSDMNGKPVGMLQLTSGRAAVLRLERRLACLCGVILIAALTISAGVYAYLWRAVGAPLQRLTSAANAAALAGWSDGLISHANGDEIGELTHALTDMAAALEQERQRLLQASIRDALTGLLNHRQLHERLAQEVERARRYRRNLSVLMLDVDHFKYLNDLQGHQVGDHVLVSLAQELVAMLRNADLIYRYGGDEFAVILPETGISQALATAERLRKRISERIIAVPASGTNGARQKDEPLKQVQVTVSIGVSDFPDDGETGAELIGAADAALLQAKRESRNAVRWCGALVNGRAGGTILSPLGAEMDTIVGIAALLDERDAHVRGHSQGVLGYALAIGRGLGLSLEDLKQLHVACLLHDIGKLSVPRAVLCKRTRLTEKEWDQIRAHSTLGAAILGHIPQLQAIIPAVLYHHERYDGTGYPQGLAGEEIPLFARIIAVADAFQAMCAGRPYRAARTVQQAMTQLRAGCGTQFDPACGEVLLAVLEEEGAAEASAAELHPHDALLIAADK